MNAMKGVRHDHRGAAATRGVRQRHASPVPARIAVSAMAGALPVSSLVMLSVATCAIVFLQTVAMLASPVVRWSSVNDALREGMLPVGLVIAVFAAWSGRTLSRASVVVGRVCGRGPHVMVFRRIRSMSVAVLVGYVAGVAALLIRTACRATWGGLSVAAAVADGLAVPLLCAFATTLGALVESRWSYCVVPAATLALMVLPWAVTGAVLSGTGRSVLSLGVVWMDTFPEVGWEPTWQGGVFRCVLFAAATLALTRYCMARVTGYPAHTDMTVWCGAVVCAAMMVSAVFWPVPLVRQDAESLSCAREADVVLCVHPADEPLRPLMVPTAQAVLRLAPQADAMEVVESVYANQALDSGMAVLSAPGAATSRGELEQTVVESLAGVVSGADACLQSDVSSGEDADLAEIASAIDASIRRRMGVESVPIGVDEATGEPVYSAYQPVLDKLDDTAFSAWYGRHREAIRACRVTEADLP